MTDTSEQLQLPGLKGKRIVITAAGGGIGLAIARRLKQQGARLAICDIDETALESASEELSPEVPNVFCIRQLSLSPLTRSYSCRWSITSTGSPLQLYQLPRWLGLSASG